MRLLVQSLFHLTARAIGCSAQTAPRSLAQERCIHIALPKLTKKGGQYRRVKAAKRCKAPKKKKKVPPICMAEKLIRLPGKWDYNRCANRACQKKKGSCPKPPLGKCPPKK